MSRRLERVKSQILRLLGEILIKEGSGLGIGMVSINDIVVSRDLSSAKVWVSFINEPDNEGAFKRLLKNGREIQTQLYEQLPIKQVPKIIWKLDVDPEGAYRIEQLLDDIRRNEKSDSDSKGGSA